MNNSRIIVSLDFSNEKIAINFARSIDPDKCRVKIGKELFTHCGPQVVDKIRELGFEIFLDLKFHDIPNTVSAACKAAAELGVWMLNVHSMGGRNMIHAAREAIDKSAHKPLLIAVTVLTSISDFDLKELGFSSNTEEQVIKLASISKDCGADGVVCSAQDVSHIRQNFGKTFCLVTPGIRPLDSSANDQKRILTPADAILAGSDYLVIGRPITQAKDPLKALSNIEDEVNKALNIVDSR